MRHIVRIAITRPYLLGAVAGVWAAVCCAPGAHADGLPGKWVEVRTPHFVVMSSAGRQPTRRIATHFEQIRALFSQALPGRLPESKPPLRVFAAGSERTMKPLLPEFWEERNRARPAGVFRFTPTGTQVVVRADLLGSESFGTVYHEYFHFLAHGTGAEVPVWLSEGLASYWGTTRLTAKAAEVGRPSITRLDYLRGSYFLPLDELMAVDRSSPHYSHDDKAQQFYAQSWALTHYLMVGDRSGKGRERLIDYLLRIKAGQSEKEARKAFGDLEELESVLKVYIRKLRFPYYEMEPPAPLAESEVHVRNLPKAEATALVARFRLESGQKQGLEEMVAFATERAPDLAETQLAAGLFHTWSHELEQAEQAFGRAVKLADPPALAHYGLAVMRFYRDPSPAGLEAVEGHLVRAIALDPELAPAKARLAEVYRRRGEGCSGQALTHIRDARILNPRYSPYQLKEAQLLELCGKGDEARTILRRAVEEAADSADALVNNQVCWIGSLWGFAGEVLPACDLAVELDSESFAIFDSRGIARAIAGDLEGAVADLREALKLAGEGWQEEKKAQRGAWIHSLEGGTNPFSGEGLARLRDDPAVVGLEWGH